MIKFDRKIDMVDLFNQYQHIKEEVDNGIAEVINTGKFINGPAVKSFTAGLQDYLGVKHVIPCANGTDALQIAMMALDPKPGDEIITVSFTFVATAEVGALLNMKPVFVDINPDDFTLDLEKLEQAITPKTKCIVPVHLFGQCANMEGIMAIAKKHGIKVIEDNAQSIGSEYYFSDGKRLKAGTIGDIGTTSFYPSKNLGCYGDGGALFTNDDELAERLKMIANHGQVKKYTYAHIGVNSRLDSFQAVVLNAKLKHLDEYIAARNRAADYYDEAFKDLTGIKIPFRVKHSNHVFHQYTLIIEGDRDAFRERLKEKGIPSMVYYPKPLHLEEAYRHYGYQAGDLPNTELLAKQVISLPMHTELDEEQLKFICEAVKECL